MYNNRYSKVLTTILVIVIIAIVGLLGYFGYDYYRKYYITKEAGEALAEFDKQFTNIGKNETTGDSQDSNIIAPTFNENLNTNTSTNSNSNRIQYKGYDVAGKIEIPKTKVEYPVLTKVTKKSIEVAVAILYGPGLNQVGNTVIVGHNYRNNLFFSNNKKLVNGDKIYITDNSGNRVTYTIYNTYTTSPEDFDYAIRDTNGKREISLSTCTDDVKQRLIIWARED